MGYSIYEDRGVMKSYGKWINLPCMAPPEAAALAWHIELMIIADSLPLKSSRHRKHGSILRSPKFTLSDRFGSWL